MSVWLIVLVLWLYLQLVHRTSKFQWIGKQYEEALCQKGVPYLIAFWHNRQAYLLYPYRNRRISILISPSRDGEIVARLAKLLGLFSVRGSSRKGPAKAVRSLLQAVEAGFSLAITPDGPLGPAQEVKGGVVYLAQTLNLPILPLTASSSRKKILKSWDSFLLPFPFSRIYLACGKPIWVHGQDSLIRKAEELKDSLDAISKQVDDLAHSV